MVVLCYHKRAKEPKPLSKARKSKTAEIAEALARYERTTAFLPLYIYAASRKNGEIIPEFYSPVVERITGYAREQFLSDPWFWFTLVYEEDKPIVEEAIKIGLTQEHEATEYRIVRKDGAIRWVHDQMRVTFDKYGEPDGYYGTVEDITARKEIEAELASSEERYRMLVERADDIIYLLDENGKITSVNTAGERFFAIPREQIIGLDWAAFLARFGAILKPDAAGLKEELRSGSARVMVEFTASEVRDAAIFEFRLTASRHSKPKTICGVGRDITLLEKQRQELADAYLQLSQMQHQIVRSERMVAMAQMASTLMHEINNPLAVMLGYAEMLPQIHDLPVALLNPLRKIEENALRISEIIKQLSNFDDILVDFGGTKIVDLHRECNDKNNADNDKNNDHSGKNNE